MPNIIETFRNEDEGTEAFVTLSADGYHVALKDLDSGEFLPHVRIFPENMGGGSGRALAIDLAKSWANV